MNTVGVIQTISTKYNQTFLVNTNTSIHWICFDIALRFVMPNLYLIYGRCAESAPEKKSRLIQTTSVHHIVRISREQNARTQRVFTGIPS